MIKKTLLGLASTAILSTGLLAEDNDTGFMGIGIAVSNISAQATKKDIVSANRAGRGETLSIGVQNDYSRRYLEYINNYDKTEKGIDSSVSSINLNYDVFLQGAKSSIKPFIGVHIGNGKFKISGNRDTLSGNGLQYGANIGFIISESDEAQVELGYKSTISEMEGSLDTTKVELTNMNQVYIRLNISM